MQQNMRLQCSNRAGRVPRVAPVVIKKYGNRRLYDTRGSRYVNLQELMDLFASEEQLQVLDAASGEDLTEKTVTQAILSEEGRRGGPLMPLDLMRAFLRYRRGSRRSDFERHLTLAVAKFDQKYG